MSDIRNKFLDHHLRAGRTGCACCKEPISMDAYDTWHFIGDRLFCSDFCIIVGQAFDSVAEHAKYDRSCKCTCQVTQATPVTSPHYGPHLPQSKVQIPSKFRYMRSRRLTHLIQQDSNLFKGIVMYLSIRGRRFMENDIQEICTLLGKADLSYARYCDALKTTASMSRCQNVLATIWINCPPMRRWLLGFEGNTALIDLSLLDSHLLELMLKADVKKRKQCTPMGRLIDTEIDNRPFPMVAE